MTGNRQSPLPGPSESDIRVALQEITDPELPISIVALGLVRGIRCRDREVAIDLTYTSLGCPWTEFIREAVIARVQAMPGVDTVTVNDVWEQHWTPSDIDGRGRAALQARHLAP